MAEAKYFHSTLYRFAPPAYNEVINRFNAAIDDVSARCWYDTVQDVFCLKCPGEIGHLANTALNDVLVQYEAEELARAEREDRAPYISSFDDAALESEPDCPEPDHAPVSKTHSTKPSSALHIINLEGNTASKVKFFRLRDLPAGLVDRILSPEEAKARRACQNGVTARAVAWNSRNEIYIFNGRYGGPLDGTDLAILQFIHASRFNEILDLRPSTELPSNANAAPAKTWKFKSDQPLDIKRFLEGMGELQFEDPEVEPVKPADAAGFLKNPTLPDLPYGRPRVPAKNQSSGDEADVDSDDEVKSVHSVSSAGSEDGASHGLQLLMGAATDSQKTPTLANPRLSISNEAPSALQLLTGSITDDQKTPTLTNPVPALPNQPATPPGDNAASSTMDISSPDTTPSSSRTLPPHLRKRQSNGNNSGSSHAETIPTWNRPYAQVDRIGLGGIPGNQAAWDHENPAPKKYATNKSGISRRLHEAGAISNTASQSGGQQLLFSAASSSSPSLRTPCIQHENTGPQKWEKIVYQPACFGPKLIDDTGPPTSNTPVKVPPGLQQFGKYEQPSSNGIVERLQEMPNISNEKKYTMNQKARKPRGKKPTNNQAHNNAFLPMPDPMPVQNRKVVNQAATNPVNSDLRVESSDDEEESLSAPPVQPFITLKKFLGDLTAAGESNDAEVHVNFGMALTSQLGTKDVLLKGAATKEQLETKLQANANSMDTTFLTRLTTSANDAAHLLSLCPVSMLAAKMHYEIIIKTPEGSQRAIKVDPSARQSYYVSAASESVATLYIHYPIRTWDAKVTIEKPVADPASLAAVQFISSMQSVDQVPSLVANIPQASFNIEKICAKRIFTKTAAGGFELTVTEVQDLMLESVSDARYNVKASALPQDEMAGAQRLWWECSLHSKIVEVESAALLQKTIDTMVTKMDGVGFGNKGPWQKADVDEGQGVTEQWFW